MMEHHEIKALLAAAAGGDLSGDQRIMLEQHLLECPDCLTEYEQLKELFHAVRSTPEIEPPPWLASRIMARIKDEPTAGRSWFARLFLPLHLKLPLEAFALLMVCVTAWHVMQDVRPAPQKTEETQIPSAKKQDTSDTSLHSAGHPGEQKAVNPRKTTEQPASTASSLVSPEAPAAAPAPAAPAFVPPPSRQKISDSFMGKSKASEESLAAPSLNSREHPQGVSAPAAERKKAVDQKSEMADKSFAPSPAPLFRIKVLTGNIDGFAEKLGVIAKSVGASVISSDSSSMQFRIDAAKLPEFLSRLGQISKIVERPASEVHSSGQIKLQILW